MQKTGAQLPEPIAAALGLVAVFEACGSFLFGVFMAFLSVTNLGTAERTWSSGISRNRFRFCSRALSRPPPPLCCRANDCFAPRRRVLSSPELVLSFVTIVASLVSASREAHADRTRVSREADDR